MSAHLVNRLSPLNSMLEKGKSYGLRSSSQFKETESKDVWGKQFSFKQVRPKLHPMATLILMGNVVVSWRVPGIKRRLVMGDDKPSAAAGKEDRARLGGH